MAQGVRSNRLIAAGIFVVALFSAMPGFADSLDDFIAGSGTVGKLGIDVMQDFALEGMSSEESGKARLKDFLKGKGLDELRNLTTGGGDLSEGMGLILNRIFEGVDQKSRQRSKRCETVALSHAWAVASDARHTRLLRGAGNVWFDLMTSGIPGAPGLARKLVEETGKLAYEKTRAEIEKRIQAEWAKSQPERFESSRNIGDCAVKMTAIWNKKKGAYLFTIYGTCGCKEASGGGAKVLMRDYIVMGVGKVGVKLDASDPSRPKVRYSISFPQIRVAADCKCGTTIEDPPPPPPEESPITLLESGRIDMSRLEARCEACEDELDLVRRYVGNFNTKAKAADDIRDRVQDMKFKTPERDRLVAQWKQLREELEKIERQHDKAFEAFVACEQTECTLGEGRLYLEGRSELGEGYTSCEECKPLLAELNKAIDEINPIIREMNDIAAVTRKTEIKLGTQLGNDTYRKYQKLLNQYNTKAQVVAAKRTALSICKAEKCARTRWKLFDKLSVATGACTRCKPAEKAYNDVIREYNAAVDIMNEYITWEQDYILKNGDVSQASYDARESKKQEIGFRDALGKLNSTYDRSRPLLENLQNCIEKYCQGVVDDSFIGIGGGVTPLEPKGAEGREPFGSYVPSSDATPRPLPTVPGKISTRCTACKPIVADYNAIIDRLPGVQAQVKAASEKFFEADLLFKAAASAVNGFELFTREYDEKGDPTRYVVQSAGIAGDSGSGTVYTSSNARYFNSEGEFNLARDAAIERRNRAEKELVAAKEALQKIEFEHDRLFKSLTGLVANLVACERSCASVVVRDVRIVTGNNPYDPRNPVAEDSTGAVTGGSGGTTSAGGGTTTGGGGGGGFVATVQVVNNIPISRLALSAPDACPINHYHDAAFGVPTANCNGVLTLDPAPGVCGHGTITDVVSIPVTACPDL